MKDEAKDLMRALTGAIARALLATRHNDAAGLKQAKADAETLVSELVHKHVHGGDAVKLKRAVYEQCMEALEALTDDECARLIQEEDLGVLDVDAYDPARVVYRPSEERSIKLQIKEAIKKVGDLGGLAAFKSGEWLLCLIQKSFQSYFENADADYFRRKYKSRNNEFIADKLIAVAVGNATVLGGATGLAISVDEVVALFTGGEGLIGLPANLAIAATTIAGEAVLLARIHLKLIAALAKLYGAPLDPNDPEDILIILAYALGGGGAEGAGKLGIKLGGKARQTIVIRFVKKDVLQNLQALGRKLGVKILQRTVVKSVVPVISVGIGALWNRWATQAVGRVGRKHMLERGKGRLSA